MSWYVAYLIVAIVVAVGTFLAAQWYRHENIAAPDSPGVASAVVGALWPVMLVGMSEMALVWLVFRGVGHAR